MLILVDQCSDPVVHSIPYVAGVVSHPERAAGGGALRRLGAGAFAYVEPLRPYGPYYAALIEYLADSHKVIAFPYDWRLSPEVEAKRLAMDVLRAVAEANAVGKPVRILAHSMGGLIARAMVHNHPEAWKRWLRIPVRV